MNVSLVRNGLLHFELFEVDAYGVRTEQDVVQKLKIIYIHLFVAIFFSSVHVKANRLLVRTCLIT